MKRFKIVRCDGSDGEDGYFNLFIDGVFVFSGLECHCNDKLRELL